MDISVAGPYYYDQVTCIDRQIEELEARKAAILAGTCYIGPINSNPYDNYWYEEGVTAEFAKHFG